MSNRSPSIFQKLYCCIFFGACKKKLSSTKARQTPSLPRLLATLYSVKRDFTSNYCKTCSCMSAELQVFDRIQMSSYRQALVIPVIKIWFCIRFARRDKHSTVSKHIPKFSTITKKQLCTVLWWYTNNFRTNAF